MDGQPRDTAFNAVATIDCKPERGYLMRSHTMQGLQGEFTLNVVDHGYACDMPARGGKVIYTMKITESGEWDERGEFRPDGQTTGFPTSQMVVRRTN